MNAAKASPGPRAPLVELGIGAAWLLGISAACQIVGAVFRTNPMATVVVQAVVVDLAVGRAGVRWDPEAEAEQPEAKEAKESEVGRAFRGIGVGAGLALSVAAAVMGVSVVVGWAKVGAHVPTTSLALGLLRAAATGVRDALLYAGLPLYFVGRAGGPQGAAVVFGALAGGAGIALQPAATPANVAIAVAVSGAAAALWARQGAGWAAAGLVGGWAFLAGAVLRGGLFDVDWKKGTLATGFAGDGAPLWIAAVLFVGAGIWSLWGRSGVKAGSVRASGSGSVR